MQVPRRRLLQLGLAAAVGLARPRPLLAAPGLARSLIVVWLKGGASQLETFDPRPAATRVLETPVPGLTLSGHFPALAQRARHLSLVRALAAREGDHDRAATLLHTGFRPSLTVRHPALGSILAAETPAAADVPPFVVLGDAPLADPGYLGSALGPLRQPLATLGPRALGDGVATDDARRAARRELLARLEGPFARATGLRPGRASPGHDRPVSARVAAVAAAERWITGPLGAALDVTRDAEALARYGEGEVARGLVAARRLVGAGVRAVEVVADGWDDHERIGERLPARAQALDRALAALLDDLERSGALASTLVLVAGEFGRTPVLNARGGRDHDPRVGSALLFGGGLAPGRVVGATTPDGLGPEAPTSAADLFATLLARFGVDPAAERQAGDRPVGITDGGTPLAGLL